MKVLVTGVSGRLGPYLVRELSQAGHTVEMMSRREPDESLRHLPWHPGDINCFEDCERAVAGGFDAIQHAAAQPWPVDHPNLRAKAEEQGIPFDVTMKSNIMGLYYLLQAAVAKDIGTFVMTGSNCALGHGFRISGSDFPYQYLPIDEQHPSNVEDSYSYSKLVGEELLASFSRAYGLRTHVLRSAGIHDAARRAQMAANAKPCGTWNPWLYCWVASEDVATAHRLLMEQAESIPAHGVYYCNADDTVALEPSRELVERFRPELVPLIRELNGHDSLLSNRALRETVGWVHEHSWRER